MKDAYYLTLKKENKQLKNQITSLNLFIRKLEEKIEASNQIIKIQEDKLQYFDSLKQNSNWFIKNCIRNLAISKNHRRYSEKMYNFCYSLHITSPKAYKLLKQVIPLPSKSTLYAKFSEPIREIKESLTTLNISQRLSYIDVNYFTNNIPVALSIDATVASPQPFSNVKIKNLFLLQIQPLCYEYKNIPFTLLTSENGQMNENIKLQIDDIVSQLSSHFKIVFKCTDGDQGTNIWHSQKFDEISKYLILNLSEIIKFIQFDQWPISDFLHILKNQRCRLFHNLSLIGNSEIISMNSFYDILHTKAFSDKSSLSKFNDKLALDVFSMKNTQTLMNLSKHSHFYYLLPFALWNTVLRSEILDLNTRKQILEIVYFIFTTEYFNLQFNYDRNISEKYKNNCERITFYTKIKLKRIINSIIGLYYALESYPNQLALNRISSHPIENTFGITRSMMQNKIGIDSFISSLTQTIFRSKILSDLKIKTPHHRKISDAGIHLTGLENKSIHCNFEQIKWEILNLRGSICNGIDFKYDKTVLKILIDFLANDSTMLTKGVAQNSVSGSGIVARNIASSNFNQY